MEEAKHTPGPWRVFGKMTGKIVAPDGTGLVEVCEVGAFRDPELAPWHHQRWNADARLIAAAPDLLEALASLVKAVEDGCYCSEMEMATRVDEARAAIARAKGETT